MSARERPAPVAQGRDLPATARVAVATVLASVALVAVALTTTSLDRSSPAAGAPTGTGLGAAVAGVPTAPTAPPPPATEQAQTGMRVRIPAIGVDAAVISLGLHPDGTLEVPSRFDLTGWWRGGTLPGDRGPAVIVGHVDSVSGPAVFARLTSVRPGDMVSVTRPDGTVARFEVTSSGEYLKSSFPTELVYGEIPYAGLRLITCSGAFDRSTGHYVDNYIVFARRVAA